MTDFTDMEYKLTKELINITSFAHVARVWGCTARTIINRLRRFEKQ